MAEREELTAGLAAERRALLAHCYRMLGSADEAEDAVQDTSLRAWRGWEAYQGQASVRTWLFRIATNVCLTALEGRGRRALPSGLGGPTEDAATPAEMAGPDVWVQPFRTDPADVVAARSHLRLALVAGLQYLPPRQRAVLLLREVLAFSSAEVAEMLGLSVPAVKSALQRARTRIEEVAPTPDSVAEPDSPRAKELLDGYLRAWETADLAAFERVLRADASLEMVPSRTWFAPKTGCVAAAAGSIGAPGDWRMEPLEVNGQPAVATYWHGEPFGIAVLDTTDDGIAGLVLFLDPALPDRFVTSAP